MYIGVVFFFKQKTAYEMRISDWSSDVCSSDLGVSAGAGRSAFCSGPISELASGPVSSSCPPLHAASINRAAGIVHRIIVILLRGRNVRSGTEVSPPRPIRASPHRRDDDGVATRSEEHTSELQSLMRISSAVS